MHACSFVACRSCQSAYGEDERIANVDVLNIVLERATYDVAGMFLEAHYVDKQVSKVHSFERLCVNFYINTHYFCLVEKGGTFKQNRHRSNASQGAIQFCAL